MKKGVNILWVLMTTIALAILVLSCFKCVNGVSNPFFNNGFVGELDRGLIEAGALIDDNKTLLLFTLIPSLFSVFAFFRVNTKLNIVGNVVLFSQALVVTFADVVYEFIEDVFADYGKITYEYNVTRIGMVVTILCWMLFSISLIYIPKCLSTAKTNDMHSAKVKPIAIILTIVLSVASSPIVILYLLTLLCMVLSAANGDVFAESSLLFCAALLTIVFVLIILLSFFSIKKAIKTGLRKYLWLLVIAILLIVLSQLIFRNQFINVWDYMFKPIVYSDGPAILLN